MNASQVREFVQKQLARYWNDAVPVFPYSVRPGFEHLRAELDGSLLSQARADAGEHHAAILLHKLDSLLTECADYLNVALKAAEVADSEREELRRRILGQKESLDDTRLALKLIVRHATANTRSTFEALLARTTSYPCGGSFRPASTVSSHHGPGVWVSRPRSSTTGWAPA